MCVCVCVRVCAILRVERRLTSYVRVYVPLNSSVRNQELQRLTAYMVYQACTFIAWSGLPLLVSLSSFFMFTFLGNQLTAAKAFTSLALFNVLRFPMAMLPNVINNIVEARVSLNRIFVCVCCQVF